MKVRPIIILAAGLALVIWGIYGLANDFQPSPGRRSPGSRLILGAIGALVGGALLLKDKFRR